MGNDGSPASPRIHVLTPIEVPGGDRSFRDEVASLAESAQGSLRSAGAVVDSIDVAADDRPSIDRVRAADGLLLLGGGDIDPALYGGDREHPAVAGVHRPSDEYSIAAVRAARAGGVPVLGICRGHQVINVAAGGSLHEGLPDTGIHRAGSTGAEFASEMVRLDTDSWAGRLYGGDLLVRGGHHQAVRSLGAGLRATAWAVDGVIEGLQAIDGWCVGVQWHPEEASASAADAAALFGGFVAVCAG